MPIETSLLEKIESELNAIASELILASAGSDDGLLPIYSISTTLLETVGEESPTLTEALNNLKAALDRLFETAEPFDSETLNYISEFTTWGQTNLELLKKDSPLTSFPPMAEPQPKKEVQNADEPELDVPKDELLVVDMSDDTELLQEFQSEALEHLEQIESVLLNLENEPTNPDSLKALFRAFHTIKGVAGFLNLTPIQTLAHHIESLLDLARNEKLVLSSSMITTILKSKDAIQSFVDQITQALTDGTTPSEVITTEQIIREAMLACMGKAPESAPAKPVDTTAPEPQSTPEAATPAEAEAPKTEAAPTPAKPPKQAAPKAAARPAATIRVNTDKLDDLMDTVGELVITQSQIQESSKGHAQLNPKLQRNLAQLARISKELQHTSMSLRMVPIGATFQKMGRIVRDVSGKLQKKVNFIVSGEETELDRNVVEQIGDPLVHMVRNAVDHGIEDTETRKQTGKDPAGTVTLKAYHMGGNIVIDLIDNGRGLDPEKLLAKAIKNGLVSADQSFTDQEIYQFIFMAGFSTAAQVTDVSGRGVGMDVVRQNIEKLRGKVEIFSQLGHGTTFSIKLPLTTAIIDGLLVRTGTERFILPTLSVKVALRPEDYQITYIQGNTEVLDLRGQSIPVVRLHQIFDIENAVKKPTDGILVIVETLGKPYALLVDEMIGKQEVVIKSLGNSMRHVGGIAGGAILGDGSVALILDVATLRSNTKKLQKAG